MARGPHSKVCGPAVQKAQYLISTLPEMRDNIARQKAVYLKTHGVEMSPSQNAHTLATMLQLQSFFYEDIPDTAAPVHRFLDPGFWSCVFPEGFSCDPLTLGASLLESSAARQPTPGPYNPSSTSMVSLTEQGFHLETPLEPKATRVRLLCAKLTLSLIELQKIGLPPPFLFVLDDFWLLLNEQWDAADSVLGETVMEPDMNIWALLKSPPLNGGYMGGNFSASHRDQKYSSCHSEGGGAPCSVNLWTSFNPSGAHATNGAMRVLPIADDDFFFSPDHPSHSETKKSLDGNEHKVVILSAAAGVACMWVPSLIHYGGGCDVDSPLEPRSSMAVTFRQVGAARSEFGGGGGGSLSAPTAGPPPLTRSHLTHLTLTRRISYVAKALISFSHWHPGFPGFNCY